MSTSVSNRDGYDRWSSFYDQYPNSTVAADELHFPDHLRHLSGLHIVEIGCGTGRHTLRLANQGNHVLAIDLSPGMLHVARAKLLGKPVQLVEADFSTYEGLEPGSADAVVASLMLEHVRDLPRFFARISMVARPAAQIFLSEIHPTRAAGGSLAHFTDSGTGEDLRLDSIAHSDEHMRSAVRGAGLAIAAELDILGDGRLAALRPGWSRYLGLPMIKIWALEAPQRRDGR